jgi:shikimate kinase
MPAENDVHLTLVGMMGSGKTTIGRTLSMLAGRPFVDLDHEIEAGRHKTIAQIFEESGEETFREMEYETIARVVDEAPAVIATGGGAVQFERNRELLWPRSHVIYLRASLDCLWERVRRSRNRPLLHQADPREVLAGLLQNREQHYLLAHEIVDVEHHSPEAIARQIWHDYLGRS